MPKVLARPEQTKSRYPLSAVAGRDAADVWLAYPVLSLCTFRDHRFNAHACGMGWSDLVERRRVFNDAFAQGIADAIVGVVVVAVEVRHA